MIEIKKKGIMLILTIILGLGISLASVYFMNAYKDLRENEIATGLISLDYIDEDTINITSSVPVIDDVGIENLPYEFNIKNTSKVPINVDIKLDVLDTTTMEYSGVRYALYINDEFIKKDYVNKDNLNIYTYENINPNEVLNCKLVFWIDYYYDEPEQVFSAKVKVEGKSIDIIYKDATFLPGTDFNIKIKELANSNIDFTQEITSWADNNILKIERANVLNITPNEDNILSTNDSEVPIYGWFDNGTLYYYTYSTNPHTNSNAEYMFSNLKNLVSIDISTLNTDKTTSMSRMFYGDSSLTQLNISNFETKNVIQMYGMFQGDEKLEYLDLSNFNTSNVTNMGAMFYDNSKLKTLIIDSFNTEKVTDMNNMFMYCGAITDLDLSNFDMASVSRVERMISNMASLKSLKTPRLYPSNLSIELPKTMYDESNNVYTELNSNSPTQIWLKSEQNS